MSKSDRQRRWVLKGIRQMERRITQKGLSKQEREKAKGSLVKLAFYMLDDMEKVK